jgi:hypothetical protein
VLGQVGRDLGARLAEPELEVAAVIPLPPPAAAVEDAKAA